MSLCVLLAVLLLYHNVLAGVDASMASNWADWIIVPAHVDAKINNNYPSEPSGRSYPVTTYYSPLSRTIKSEPYVLAISKQNGRGTATGNDVIMPIGIYGIVDKLRAVYEVVQEFVSDDLENIDHQNAASSRKIKLKKIKKKYKKFLFPLLIAYKLKFLTLVPVLIGGLVLLVGTTGMAGFFFALFASIMSLKSESKVVYKKIH